MHTTDVFAHNQDEHWSVPPGNKPHLVENTTVKTRRQRRRHTLTFSFADRSRAEVQILRSVLSDPTRASLTTSCSSDIFARQEAASAVRRLTAGAPVASLKARLLFSVFAAATNKSWGTKLCLILKHRTLLQFRFLQIQQIVKYNRG